jgi:hypothetical protein
MCGPMGAILKGVGTGIQSEGDWMQAEADMGAARWDASTDRAKSKMAKSQAERTRQLGELEETVQRRKTERTKGDLTAAYAAAGVAVNVGTSADLLVDAAGIGELDALIIRDNAKTEAESLEFLAATLEQRANFNDQRAENIERAGILDFVGTNIAGAASF